MLFDVIPENFFSPLASPGKTVYWECIQRLYAVTSRQLSFGVERDVLVSDLEYYFDSSMAAQIPQEDQAEGEAGRSSRDQANFVLRRLESWGWIYTETDHSYVQRVNFRDYAVKIIQALQDVAEERKTEYQGFIYTIYSLVQMETNPGYVLMEITGQTEGLITALKNLSSNIKTYIDGLTKHKDVAEILDALLNDYYTNIVDKAYHRLLTSDNVAKFRPVIIEKLEADSRNENYPRQAAAEVAERSECTPEQAREEVLTMIHQVTDAFRRMDDIINEINRKNTKYQRAAINRARFFLTSGDDLRGQLREIISWLNEKITRENLAFDGVYELEELDQLIRIFSWEYLDMDSLYAPIEGKKAFLPSVQKRQKVDAAARQARRLAMEEKLARILTPQKIDAYVRMVMQDRERMRASQFPLEGDGFIRLIYIRLYGQRKNMSYRLQLLEETELGGFHFRDFYIIRKKTGV